MKLNEYIQQLQELLVANPELGDVEVAYAKDDEGNGYSTSVFSPSVRYKMIDEDGYSFDTVIDRENDPEEYEDYKDELEPIVLIN